MSIYGITESKLRSICDKKGTTTKENIVQADMRGKSKYGVIIFIDDNVKYYFSKNITFLC